eukprot:631424-Heterocapsa_arctica.AAC.1
MEARKVERAPRLLQGGGIREPEAVARSPLEAKGCPRRLLENGRPEVRQGRILAKRQGQRQGRQKRRPGQGRLQEHGLLS